MTEAALSIEPADLHQQKTSRLLVVSAILLFSLSYTGLTLFGSWDILLQKPGVIRLGATIKAPLTMYGAEDYGELRSLPDDWRDAPFVSNVWRYRFVFELQSLPNEHQQIYIPRVGDNAQLSINGKMLPHFGRLESKPDLHWSVPALFPVKAERFRLGSNELLVDVYANEVAMGSLSTVSIGPTGIFSHHIAAVYATKRGLAYVLLGLIVFAIFSFSVYAAAVSNQFYVAGLSLCVSLLGCLLPHLIDEPVASIQVVFSITLVSFILLMNCLIYLCSLMFHINRRFLYFIYGLNGLNILAHLAMPFVFDSYDEAVDHLFSANLLIFVSGALGVWLITKQFLLEGDPAVGMILSFAIFMTCLGLRDFMVLWGWLPWYHGLYTLHCIAASGFCLIGVVALRIREANQEQLQYHQSMQEALVDTKEEISQSRGVEPKVPLDALVSRIATTYSHEFRNPLAAALATCQTLRKENLDTEKRYNLLSIEKGINDISDALADQFDFQRAMQAPGQQTEHQGLPDWLHFVSDHQSCKIVWLSDPSILPDDSDREIREWLQPLLLSFNKIPSVCLVQLKGKGTVFHLYLHTNASDLLHENVPGRQKIELLNPDSVRETVDGQYYYWRYEFN